MNDEIEGEKKQKWGVDTYAKWDNFDDESDEEKDSNIQQAKKILPTQFNLAPPSMKIEPINYILNGQIPELKEKEKRFKNLPQKEKEIWQVVIRKLNAWSASSATNEPIRPYAIFVNCLFPDGRAIIQDICNPPEKYPVILIWFHEYVALDGKTILSTVTRAMMNPQSGKQRKPKCLTFTDPNLAGNLFETFKHIGVEVSELTESDGIDDMVREFSRVLVKKDMCSLGENSLSPSIIEQEGVTIENLKVLYKLSSEIGTRQPWQFVHERRAFKITTESSGIKKAIWVALIGNEVVHGLAIFFSKLDLEARLTPSGEKVYIHPAHKEHLERTCSYTKKTEAEVGHKLKSTVPRKFDIRTGISLQYADADALRSHWPEVRKYAKPYSELEEGLRQGRQYWYGEECVMMFESPTAIPFEEHDLIEKHKLDLCKKNETIGEKRFPFFGALKCKDNDQIVRIRPNSLQLSWIESACRSILHLMDLIDENKISGNDDINIEFQIQKGPSSNNETEKVQLESSPVFFVSEAIGAAKRKEEKEIKESETKVGENPSTQSNCVIS